MLPLLLQRSKKTEQYWVFKSCVERKKWSLMNAWTKGEERSLAKDILGAQLVSLASLVIYILHTSYTLIVHKSATKKEVLFRFKQAQKFQFFFNAMSHPVSHLKCPLIQ